MGSRWSWVKLKVSEVKLLQKQASLTWCQGIPLSCQSWQVWAWWLCLVSTLLDRVVGMGQPCRIVTCVLVPVGGIAVPVPPLWSEGLVCSSHLFWDLSRVNVPAGPLITYSVFSHQFFKFRKVPLRSKWNLPSWNFISCAKERCIQIRDFAVKNKDNKMLRKRKKKQRDKETHFMFV